jgi:hypothetical protein
MVMVGIRNACHTQRLRFVPRLLCTIVRIGTVVCILSGSPGRKTLSILPDRLCGPYM